MSNKGKHSSSSPAVLDAAGQDLQIQMLLNSDVGKDLAAALRMTGAASAFSLVHSLTGASRAALFKRLKDSGAHRSLGLSWKEFCPQHLSLSQPEVDEEIRKLETLGKAYFAAAAVIRISEATFKALPVANENGDIEVGGRLISPVENPDLFKKAVRDVQEKLADERKRADTATAKSSELRAELEKAKAKIREFSGGKETSFKDMRKLQRLLSESLAFLSAAAMKMEQAKREEELTEEDLLCVDGVARYGAKVWFSAAAITEEELWKAGVIQAPDDPAALFVAKKGGN